jgi:hypothetical protein
LKRADIAFLALCGALLSPGAALADADAAQTCAAALPAESKVIYEATAPEFASAEDPRALIKTKVVALVTAGKVAISTAKESAYAAAECLKKLR